MGSTFIESIEVPADWREGPWRDWQQYALAGTSFSYVLLDVEQVAARVHNAGAIFLGDYTPRSGRRLPCGVESCASHGWDGAL